MGGEIRINCSWITVFAAYYFYRSDVAFSFGTGVFLSTMVDAVPIIHGFSWRTFYMELSMTPFKQKIMAAAAFDYIGAVNASARWDAERRGGYELFKDGAAYENARLAPLLTRLVDEVEALKAALDTIANHNMQSVDKVYLIHQCEGFQLCAHRATDAHQKRWEDLK